MDSSRPDATVPDAQDYDLERIRRAVDERFNAAETRIHQLASKTEAEFAFLAFADYQFFQISMAQGRIDEYEHGNMPALVEMAAYYLYQHIGECQETDNQVVSEIIEMIPDLYHSNLMASGMGSFSDELAGNVIGPSKIHAQTVRGSAWPDQTRSEILGIQGAFDSWFTNRIGISPSRAIAILELIEEAINIQVNEVRRGAFADSSSAPDPGSSPETIREYFQEKMENVAEQITRAIAVDRESVPIEPKITVEEWTALLVLVGLTPSAVKSMSSPAEVSQRPLFVIGGGRAFYLDQSTLYDALYDAFDLVARGDQKFYSGKYTSHLSEWVEGQTMAHLARIFPPESLYSNLTYPDPDKQGGETELDGMILWGPFQILVEVKGRQFRLAGRLNEPGKLRTDLKKNIEEAFDQALRAQRYIDSSSSPEFKEQGSGRIAKVNKTGKHFRFVISVSLHHLGPITTQLAVLKEVGLLKNGQYPWSVCLADLEVICQFAGSPDVLLHYVKRRVELQESERAIQGDELDLFGNYLDNRLHPAIYWNRKTESGGDYNFMHIAGGSERFQE